MNPLWTIYSNLLIQQRTELSVLSAEYTVDDDVLALLIKGSVFFLNSRI